jgi:magnesium transporter
MPSLPRIRRARTRVGDGAVLAPSEPRLAEISAHGLTWVQLEAPTAEEATELRERFGWHPLDLEDVLSRRERPKVDDYADEGYLFAVLHFPVYDKTIQRLNAGELDSFIGQDYLVTLPNVELLPVSRLFDRCQQDEALRDQLFSKGSGYLLYHVLDDLFDYCFPILDKIAFKLQSLEDDVFEGRAEGVVRDISNAKQEIISYRKIIKPERSTLRLLEHYKEVVEALEDTNESVISHRQNDVLRVLTVFSVVLLPLTLITGFFGMNVHFPGYESGTAFWIIMGAMVALLVGLVAFFRAKRWL